MSPETIVFIANLEKLTGLAISHVRMGNNRVELYSYHNTSCSYSVEELVRLGVNNKD